MISNTGEKALIKERIIETKEGKYLYALTSSVGVETASFGIKLYSIKIEFFGQDGTHSVAEAKEHFADKHKALSFFDRLVKYLATPINLPYILEDEMP